MQSQSLTIHTDTHTQKEEEEEKSEKTQIIIIIIMRAFESFWSPYLTDTWDGAAGNGADAIYSRQAWINTKRVPTREDDHLLKPAKNKSSTRSAANAPGSRIKYRLAS